MNKDFFDALDLLEKERGISGEYLLEKIKKAITNAVCKNYDAGDNVHIIVDKKSGKFELFIRKTVVDQIETPENEILLDEAEAIDEQAKLGDTIDIYLDTKEFGRIAAQNVKQFFRQSLREAERSQMFEEMQSKTHEIVTGIVTRIDNRKGNISLEIGKNEAMLPKNEQIEGEVYKEGDHIKVYIVEVAVTERGPKVMLSRTHPGFVKRMFEVEVPEIADGIVEIKAISREAGARTKMAVYSSDENVDAVGACIGPKGARVANIVEELSGEKIDIIKYSDDPVQFIAAALSPSAVVSVELLTGEGRSCRAIVPDNQLSLAIGNKGQNARLTARLTGYNVDIRPESGYQE